MQLAASLLSHTRNLFPSSSSSATDEYGIVELDRGHRHKVQVQDRSPQRVNDYEMMSGPLICIDPEMGIRCCTRLSQH